MDDRPIVDRSELALCLIIQYTLVAHLIQMLPFNASHFYSSILTASGGTQDICFYFLFLSKITKTLITV
jgi:hypothetical protein